jgi:S1-C subfamily serine protease
MKLIIFIAAMLFATLAQAWTVENMNSTINSANFIVDRGCSGTLINKEHRLILTNHHCINSGIFTRNKKVTDENGVVSQVRVEELRDLNVSQRAYSGHRIVGESTYKAQIVARWKESDLALLQLRADDIQNPIAVTVFAGSKVQRGEVVYAVGNPRGLDATVTTGIISSTTRMYRVQWADNQEVSFIQMSAGIAPGSSGGSLFNASGELIGVPAAAVPGTVLGLAIPFFRIQEFLTNNCWGQVWNKDAESRDVCLAEDEEDETAEVEHSD